MKSRLVSIGCSFSSWYTPTPIDWLSYCFDKTSNLSWPGVCNTYISDNIHTYADTFSDKDILIIQWTGLLRYTPKRKTGDIIEFGHSRVTEWEVGNLGHPYDRVLQFYNNTRSLFSLLNNLKVDYLTTHMLSPWHGTFLGEPNSYFGGIQDENLKGEVINNYEKHFKAIKDNNLLSKIEILFKSNPYSILGMYDFYLEQDIDMRPYIPLYLTNEGTFTLDTHPHPTATLRYAREVLYPNIKNKFNLDLTGIFDDKLDEYVKIWDYFYLNEKNLIKEKVYWMEENGHKVDNPYIPWYIKDGKITEYKLPIN